MRFWDASSIALRLLLTLNVGAPTSNTSGEDSRKKSAAGINCSMQYVTKFLFCPVSRILLVGCASGTVFVYNFSTNKTIVEKKVYKHYKKKSSKDLQEPSRQGGSSKSLSGHEGSTRKKVSKIAEEQATERRKNKGEKEEAENPAPSKKDAGHPTSSKKSSSEDLASTKSTSPPTAPATLPSTTATPATATTPTTTTATAEGTPSGQPAAEMPWMPSNRPAKKVRAKPGKPAPNQGLEPQPPIKSPPVLASSTRHVPSAGATNEKAMLSASTPAVRTTTSPREGGGGLGVSVAESTTAKQTSPQILPSKPSPATSPQPGPKKPESPAAVAKNSDSPKQQTPPTRTPSPSIPPSKTESPSAVARQSANGNVAAPGLRLVLECTLNGVVKALAMALNLHMIAIGDQLGVLTLVDIETGEGLFSHNVSVSGSEPIRCLTFSESIMDQQDYERWQELHYGGQQQQQEEEQRIPKEPVLFIGGEYGTVSVLRLEEMEWRPCFEKRVGGESFAIIFLAVVTAKGKPITLASVEWEETEAVASGGDGEDEDVDKEVEDFVEIEANGEGKERDKEKEKEREALQEKRKKKKQAKAEAPYNGERFLLVCAENQIAIYSIPFFEQLAKVDLTTPIVAAHLLCYKGEWCLLTFDNEIGINVYTLTDLRPILESDWNFFEGPEMTPTAILNAVVSLDGRLIAASAKSELHRLSFFLHENLLNLPGSLPALHVRGLKMPEKPKALTKSMFSDGNISDAGDLFGTPAPSSTRNARGNNKPVLEEFADDDEELMPKKATGEKDRNGRQPRTATGSRVRDQRSQVGDVKNVMAENINKVNERGERLSELQMKSSELEAASEEYLHNIREWTKKQRNKKWYQL